MNVTVDLKFAARTESRWEGRANVARFAQEVELASGPQRLKNSVEIDIVGRWLRGTHLLDVGIGTGRVSLPLRRDGLQLTGIDASAAMIEYCARDPRSAGVRLVQGELERLPFAAESFDTVFSVDSFAHLSDWRTNLDELLRVTRVGGRTIVNVTSRDHTDAVARFRGANLEPRDTLPVTLSTSELRAYAAERNLALIALVPYGVVFGALVPNAWFAQSYAQRSGAFDRLVSWIGADPLLFAFAAFIEQRIVGQLPPTVGSRMFAVFERDAHAPAYREPQLSDIATGDERGSTAWHAEFAVHLQHEPNCSFAVALLLAARATRLPVAARSQLPDALLREIERIERALRIDEICAAAVGHLPCAPGDLTFHGVDLSSVLARGFGRILRARIEAGE